MKMWETIEDLEYKKNQRSVARAKGKWNGHFQTWFEPNYFNQDGTDGN